MAIEARKAFTNLSRPTGFSSVAGGAVLEDEGLFEASSPRAAFRKTSSAWINRTLDVVGALILLVFLMPVFLLSCFAVLLLTGRPIVISQTRIGKDGRRFQMLKLRTMVPNAHLLKSQVKHLNIMSGPFFKAKNDPRITLPGKYLRQFSLDEVPQLFNVIAGQMSLVGPRPMLPEEVEQLKCYDILAVKPGLTGLWQVSGRNLVSDFRDKLALDRRYIASKSLWLDLSILFRTAWAVFRPKGAY